MARAAIRSLVGGPSGKGSCSKRQASGSVPRKHPAAERLVSAVERARGAARRTYCFWPPEVPPEEPLMPPLEPPLDDFSPPCSRLVPPPVFVPDLLVVLVPDLVSDLVLVEPRTDVSPRVVVREW